MNNLRAVIKTAARFRNIAIYVGNQPVFVKHVIFRYKYHISLRKRVIFLLVVLKKHPEKKQSSISLSLLILSGFRF